MELLSDYVKTYKLPDEFLNSSVTLLNDEWRPHQWYTRDKDNRHEEDNDPRVNYVLSDDATKTFLPVFWDIISQYEKDISQCDPDITSEKMVSYFSAIRINVYEEGKLLRKHSDLIYSCFDHVKDPASRGIPLLSIVGDLSTDPYTGGEFYMRGRDAQLRPGHAIIFPSTFMYSHEVKPVLSGTRTSFVTWAW